MIILDEQISNEILADEIEQWYRGKVRYARELRPGTVIKDDAIPSLLLRVKEPTFVTINYEDFWSSRKIPASKQYCIVCLKLEARRWKEVSPLLRDILRLKEFNTKRRRMNKSDFVERRSGEVQVNVKGLYCEPSMRRFDVLRPLRTLWPPVDYFENSPLE